MDKHNLVGSWVLKGDNGTQRKMKPTSVDWAGEKVRAHKRRLESPSELCRLDDLCTASEEGKGRRLDLRVHKDTLKWTEGPFYLLLSPQGLTQLRITQLTLPIASFSSFRLLPPMKHD